MKKDAVAAQRSRILFFLPTLPHYRNSFFSLLTSDLKETHEILVAHGTPPKQGKTIRHESVKGFNSKVCIAKQYSLFGYRIVWLRGLLPLFVRFSPDIVIILFNYGVLTFWIVVLLCKIKNIPIAFWGSGHKRPEIKGLKLHLRNMVSDWILGLATAHICYGSRYSDELKYKRISPERIFIAQNTIDIEGLPNCADLNRDVCRGQFAILPSETLFLFVGAVIKNKKLDIAIRCVNDLLNRGQKLKFFIIGDGAEKDSLQQLILGLGIETKVKVLGPKYGSALSPYFLAADAFLLPGTGGLAINEAMAYGLPIISTEGDGTAYDLLFNGVNGFFLNNDLNNLNHALDNFLHLPPAKRHEMGEKSKEIIFAKARIGNMLSGFRTAIEFLTGQH